ncbi:hypothetical protein [Kordia sp.]|uniref:hypothetical protein n=1 Tax=Kordia sp. TaxID=1965332 RepID=UPI003D2A7D7B
MKTRIILMLAALILLNSCILKSLQPFYIAKAISYQEDFLGKWKDAEDGIWKIQSFKKLFENENNQFPKQSENDKIIYEKYKKSYVVNYTKKGKEAMFIAVTFEVNGKLFIDFTPFDIGLENENKLLAQHVVKTHSVAKIERLENKKLSFKWLDESKIKALQKQNKIRLQHEKLGVNETFVITATSEELYKFLEKFEATNEDEIWGSSEQITLEKAHAKL